VADFDRFLVPLDGDSPCGPDCEYENDFLALTQAAAGKPEQQFGDTVIPAVEPDWQEVDRLAHALLRRSKDLRVVVSLTLANAHLHGINEFAAGLKLAHQLCDQFWDTVHPRVVVDGDDDPYLRLNAIAAFFSGSEFSGEDRLTQALRNAVLLRQPQQLTLRDLEQSFNKTPDAKFALADIEPILTDALAANSASFAAVNDIYATCLALRSLVEARVSLAEMPEMDGLPNVLKPIVRGLEHLRTLSSADNAAAVYDAAADSEGDAESHAGPSRSGGSLGEIQSRDDVRKALERVCIYLEKHEPTNPASLFARRAQRMLNMPFLELMRELHPDSVPHLESLTGARAPEQNS
jgi:type VI secretion system protein ImpA